MKNWIIALTAAAMASSVYAGATPPAKDACEAGKPCAVKEAASCCTTDGSCKIKKAAACADKAACDVKKEACTAEKTVKEATCEGGVCPLKK